MDYVRNGLAATLCEKRLDSRDVEQNFLNISGYKLWAQLGWPETLWPVTTWAQLVDHIFQLIQLACVFFEAGL